MWTLTSTPKSKHISGLLKEEFIRDGMAPHEAQKPVTNFAWNRTIRSALIRNVAPRTRTGDGGAYSTVDDLYLFDRALYTDRLVRESTLAEAFTPASVQQGSTTYGFGWNIKEDGSGKRVWHTGSTAGFRAFIERRLGQRDVVIMLTNVGNSKRVEINEAIHDMLEGRNFT
jgi:CubicO group peptidase (beta-lactamase class C family)